MMSAPEDATGGVVLIPERMTARKARRSMIRHLDAARAALAAAEAEFEALGLGSDREAAMQAAAEAVVTGTEIAGMALALCEIADGLCLDDGAGSTALHAVVGVDGFGRMPLGVHLEDARRVMAVAGGSWAAGYVDAAVDCGRALLRGEAAGADPGDAS